MVSEDPGVFVGPSVTGVTTEFKSYMDFISSASKMHFNDPYCKNYSIRSEYLQELV